MKNVRTNVYAGIAGSSLSNLAQLGKNLNIAIKRRRLPCYTFSTTT